MKLGKKPVHPCTIQPNAQDKAFGIGPVTILGMTLREHYAGLAMQGLLSSMPEKYNDDETRQYWPQHIAEIALEHADALIAALEKTND